jgi:hypothetical protein
MKICTFVLGFLLVAGCALAADIDGTWSGKYSGGMGGEDMTLKYIFKADGAKLTGSSFSPDGKESPIKEGKIDGNKITFKVDVDFQGMPLKFNYKGVLSGDEIKLSFEMDMGGMPGMGGPGAGGPPAGGPPAGGPGVGGPPAGGPGGGAPAQEFTVKREKK